MEVIGRMLWSLFHKCIHETLPNRWRKCLAAKGDYFEGDDVALPPDIQLLESSSDEEEQSSDMAECADLLHAHELRLCCSKVLH